MWSLAPAKPTASTYTVPCPMSWWKIVTCQTRVMISLCYGVQNSTLRVSVSVTARPLTQASCVPIGTAIVQPCTGPNRCPSITWHVAHPLLPTHCRNPTTNRRGSTSPCLCSTRVLAVHTHGVTGWTSVDGHSRTWTATSTRPAAAAWERRWWARWCGRNPIPARATSRRRFTFPVTHSRSTCTRRRHEGCKDGAAYVYLNFEKLFQIRKNIDFLKFGFPLVLLALKI